MKYEREIAAREEKIARLLSSVPLPAEGLTPEERDERFMRAALVLARAAAEEGEVPVGCVITRGCEIVSADYNGREALRSALWHAEAAAVAKACERLGGWRLPDTTLYVTLEPCPMCAGAIWNARIPRVVVGTKDARAGAFGSVLNLNSYPLNYRSEVTFGVCADESRALLGAFFRARRNRTEN